MVSWPLFLIVQVLHKKDFVLMLSRGGGVPKVGREGHFASKKLGLV